MGRKCRRRCTHAANLLARTEIMTSLHGDVFRRRQLRPVAPAPVYIAPAPTEMPVSDAGSIKAQLPLLVWDQVLIGGEVGG